jgi:hypothetical protein
MWYLSFCFFINIENYSSKCALKIDFHIESSPVLILFQVDLENNTAGLMLVSCLAHLPNARGRYSTLTNFGEIPSSNKVLHIRRYYSP